jgi:sialic acid synthase SpsE
MRGTFVHTFVIAEAGSSHHNSLKSAHNLIEAAKEAGADAVKYQYWSSSKALAERRNTPIAEPVYAKYKLPIGWLEILSDHCKRAGLEFMCSTFLIQDIAVVAPYVDRFKVSAFESGWGDFIYAHEEYRREVIVSVNPGNKICYGSNPYTTANYKRLHCISHYPTKLADLGLSRIKTEELDGFSDHSGNVIAGAMAVGQGAKIIEAHIRLDETPKDNPDYGHSLTPFDFWLYVKHVREAEQML